VYKNAGSSLGHYIPSGYMGDARDILLKQTRDVKKTYKGEGTSLEIIYAPRGPEGWSGLYWLEPANNWGGAPCGFNLKGAEKVTFWARGLTGDEVLTEVKIGGIKGKYPDSDTVSLKNVGLSKERQMYGIDLRGKKMSHIVGGFCIIFDKYNNPDGATVYIRDSIRNTNKKMKKSKLALIISLFVFSAGCEKTPVKDLLFPAINDSQTWNDQ